MKKKKANTNLYTFVQEVSKDCETILKMSTEYSCDTDAKTGNKTEKLSIFPIGKSQRIDMLSVDVTTANPYPVRDIRLSCDQLGRRSVILDLREVSASEFKRIKSLILRHIKKVS